MIHGPDLTGFLQRVDDWFPDERWMLLFKEPFRNLSGLWRRAFYSEAIPLTERGDYFVGLGLGFGRLNPADTAEEHRLLDQRPFCKDTSYPHSIALMRELIDTWNFFCDKINRTNVLLKLRNY